MLRSLAHNAVVCRRLTRMPSRSTTFYRSVSCHEHIVLKPAFIHARLLSSPRSTSDLTSKQTSDIPPPHALQQRKHKVGLRPAPIKPARPSTISASHGPINPAQPLPKSPTLSPVSPPLNEIKETTKRDIQEAEAHGILTPPPPDANWFKRTLHKGIQLAKFYFRGVKLIFTRRRMIAEIRARVKAGGPPLTRTEFRFIHVQRDDVNKVIPFIIIALLLEEIIPLIAIYAPSFLPSTCILPSQQQRIQEKKLQKAIGYAYNYSGVFASLKEKENPAGYLSIDAIRTQETPTAICGLLGLPTYGIDTLRIHRIRRHLKFLAEDDHLLLQDRSVLSEKEVTEALEERGLVAQRLLSLKSKQAKLDWWLNSIQSSNSNNALARRLCLLTQHSAELHS